FGQASDERICCNREVRGVQTLERREVSPTVLKDPFGRREVLQPVKAEVAKTLGGAETTGRLRHEDLAAVTDSTAPRSSVRIDSDVSLVCHERLARVNSHANADRLAQRFLALSGGGQSVRRARERDEERVALRVHLDSAVARERLPERAPVLGQHLRI